MCNCGGFNNIKSSQIKIEKPDGDKNKIIYLWKGVLNNESYARAEFVRFYLQKFPNNKYLTQNLTKENLHKMYYQLTR
jgi:phosphorylcholine metabolism protein LicD